MEGSWSNHMKDTIKETIVLISMFTSKNKHLELWLCLHTAVVFISLFWTQGIDCSG